MLIVLAACIALLLAGSLSARAGRARDAACEPRTIKVEGHRATRFCGPATAAIHAGKHWFRLSGGSCAGTTTFFTINVGTAVVAANQKIPYFGLTIGQYPKAPIKPKLPLLFAGGLVLALTLAVFVAVALDLASGRVLESWQVERQLGLTVLGEVPTP